MFSYYGSKSKLVHLYPPPLYDHIIEPFAGSARYALRYADRQVTLIELYKPVFDIWNWLINEATEADIRALPDLKLGDDLRNFKQLTDVERTLMGFWTQFNRHEVQSVVTRHSVFVRGKPRPNPPFLKCRELVLEYLSRIRHWQVINSSYVDFQHDAPATWFVDPPYNNKAGRRYPCSDINYADLAEWCRSLNGQVIVCEGNDADWLPFRILKPNYNGGRNTKSTELIWTTHPELIPEQPAKCRPKKRRCNAPKVDHV